MVASTPTHQCSNSRGAERMLLLSRKTARPRSASKTFPTGPIGVMKGTNTRPANLRVSFHQQEHDRDENDSTLDLKLSHKMLPAPLGQHEPHHTNDLPGLRTHPVVWLDLSQDHEPEHVDQWLMEQYSKNDLKKIIIPVQCMAKCYHTGRRTLRRRR